MSQTFVPEGAPAGAEVLSGVVAVYEEYDAAMVARTTDPTPEAIERARKAQADLFEARSFWRGVRAAVAADAYAQWAAANPEVAAAQAAPVDTALETS